MNTAGHFSFKGDYTLRAINGTWYVYDRKLQCCKERAGDTFTKARLYLLKNYPDVRE